MAETIVSDVVVKLLEYMGESMFEKIAPYFNGRARLEDLKQTMRMIQSRLLDAERLREAENGALVKLWLKRLKHVLYRLEDLLEEVSMAEEENEQMPGGKLTKPLRICFSSSSPFKINKKLALEARGIMKELEATTTEMHSLNLRVNMIDEQHYDNLAYRRETHSFVLEEEVIGRDADKKAIVDMLLDCDNVGGDHVSVIPIVGIGGMGKTTLAQIVFNDANVHKHFELKFWACISEISSLKELVRKILKSISRDDCDQLSMEQLQMQLQRTIHSKKYLLVLDDVWDEVRERWLHLKRLLSSGKSGSKIIVTSRSRVVAMNMGTVEPYELKGLSADMSWELFKSLAYKEGQQAGNPNLTSIGREVVKKCANVPLAIRTIASLLYSKDTEIEWEAFKDGEIRMIDQNEGDIMSTLKMSYDHLPSQLKQCFAYCSLFPKDSVLEKKTLINLWMAQGFIRPSNASESPEDVGHGYFMELLRRCFFQNDVRSREDGEIITCEMHDLMHDLAQHVAGGDSVLIDASTQHLNDNIWHVNISDVSSPWKAPPSLLAAKQIRSFLLSSRSHILNIDQIFSSLRHLRALDLINLRHLCVGILKDLRIGDRIMFGEGRETLLVKPDCDCIPDSLGNLKHLRFLRLGYIVSLPRCITKLHSLQILDLPYCHNVTEFPREFSKLVNLRQLHNKYCKWDDMPPNFGQLTSLHTLDLFIVGEGTGLDVLASLVNLVDDLEIRFEKHRSEAVSESMAANLKQKKLTSLILSWPFSSCTKPATYVDEKVEDVVLEQLQLPLTLKSLKVVNWKGSRLPLWGPDEFPKLVSLHIDRCRRCKHLPLLSQLPHLKELKLSGLDALKYVEDGQHGRNEAAYFPSLETLTLYRLPQLKAWCKEGEMGGAKHKESPKFFPCLSTLYITECPMLRSTPYMPNLKSMIT